jgi:hypothetical protein
MIAYFPDAWDSKSEFLDLCYHDIPEGEPELMQEMRRPWPTTTLLWRMMKGGDRLKQILRRRELKRGPADTGQPGTSRPWREVMRLIKG